MSYNIGDAVPLVYTISQAATVTLTITDPDGVVTTPAPTQGGAPPAVTYSANISVGKAGTWLYRFVATGTVTDAEDGTFFVQANAAANVYTTVAECKAALNIPTTDTTDDALIQTAIRVESREIDSHCQRHFYKVTETRTIVPDGIWHIELGPFNDLVSVTTLKTDATGDGVFEQTWATSDYQLLTDAGTPNLNAGPEPRPYTQIRAVGSLLFPIAYNWAATRRDLVQINGTWGWPAVPDGVREACKVLATELFQLREVKFGATGISDLGIIRVGQNRTATRLLAPYSPLAAVA